MGLSMDKNLLVEIFVPTTDGADWGLIGTGYPVGQGLVLTARHVLQPENLDQNRRIELRWHHQSGEARKWGAIRGIAWEGTGDVDAAIVECEFPKGLDRWGVLSEAKPDDGMEWLSEGFARAGVKDDGSRTPVPMQGRVFSMADTASRFHLGADYAAEQAEQWKGVSGAPVFVDGKILGIVDTCPVAFAARRLAATPSWRLLQNEAFRQAIGYQQREERLRQLRRDVAEALLPAPGALKALGAELRIENRGNQDSLWAGDLADALLNGNIEDTLLVMNKAHRRLCMQQGEGARSDVSALEAAVAQMLPVLLRQVVVEETRVSVFGGFEALVSMNAATRTMAEIVMAGVDGRKAEFVKPQREKDFPVGMACVDLGVSPEIGIDDPTRPKFRDAWNTHMINEFVCEESKRAYRRDDAALIRDAAERLAADVREHGRRRYFFFHLPDEQLERADWQRAIDDLKRLYPAIVFISLRLDPELLSQEHNLLDPLRFMLTRPHGPGSSP